MKPEEIIKYLEMVKPTENYSHTFSVSVGDARHFGPGSQLNKDVSTAIDLSIQTLEKQVPKKPVELLTGDGAQMIILCGNCEEEVADNWKGCPHCLTIIDWSDE